MVKALILSLFVFFMIPSFSYANKMEAMLQSEYGYNLAHAPFFLRYAFEKAYNIQWKKSYYSERLLFLTDYEIMMAKDAAQEKEEAKEEKEHEKELASERKADIDKMKDRLKARLVEEKAEKLADEQRQRDLDDLVRQQEKELQQMQLDATQGIR